MAYTCRSPSGHSNETINHMANNLPDHNRSCSLRLQLLCGLCTIPVFGLCVKRFYVKCILKTEASVENGILELKVLLYRFLSARAQAHLAHDF